MTLLREYGDLEHFPYLAGLGLNPEDAGRLDVIHGKSDEGGILVNPATGDSQLIAPGDKAPEGVWVAQRNIDDLVQGRGEATAPARYGEGWGSQGNQLGGDRSYPEEDAGGTRRVPPAGGGQSIDRVADPSRAETDPLQEPGTVNSVQGTGSRRNGDYT